MGIVVCKILYTYVADLDAKRCLVEAREFYREIFSMLNVETLD